MSSPTSDKAVTAGAVPSFICSVHNEQGLNFLYLDQPSKLTLRIANTSSQAFQMQLADDNTRRASVRVSFDQLGGTVQPGAAPAVPRGFRVPTGAPGGLEYEVQQAVQFWAWFQDEVLVIDLPTLTVSGSSGCGFVLVTIDYLQGQVQATCQAPVLRLTAPSLAAADEDVVSTSFRQGNVINASAASLGGSALKLAITNASGFIRTAATNNQTPAFYVLLSDGLAPGLASITSAAAARLIDAKTSDDSSWRVERLGDGTYPVWRLTPDPAKPGNSVSVDLKLSNITTSATATGSGHLVVYNVNVPGANDQAQVLSAQVQAGALTIQSFAADQQTFTNISQPTQVLLSWNVQNASTVTLTNMGVVAATMTNAAVYVEQTTTFVLTAYSASLAQIASQPLTVTVKPDLVTRVIPKGTIMLWSGDTTNIPAGWALCDGSGAGIPDLRERFVLGAGSGDGYTAPNQSGPADTHTHGIGALQNTFATNTVGDHTHGMPTNWYNRGLSCGKHTGIDTSGQFSTSSQTQGGGSHAHQVTVAFGAFTSDPNAQGYRPAWYALCYIIKQGV